MQTLRLIQQGGPFPYPRKDGSTFGNFERRLPSQPRGYYREYTVPTPGSRDRGARRIIAGEGRGGDVSHLQRVLLHRRSLPQFPPDTRIAMSQNDLLKLLEDSPQAGYLPLATGVPGGVVKAAAEARASPALMSVSRL
jgi:hypothetical protein